MKTKYDLKQVEPEAVMEGIIIPESQWSYPDEKSFKKNLRALYRSHGKYVKDAKILQDHILREMTAEKIYDRMTEEILNTISPTDTNSDLSVAML